MLRTIKEVLLVWLIIFFSMLLRTYKADFYPIHNNDDSLFHVWAGISNFKNFKKPASLTIFTLKNQAMFWNSQYNNYDTVRRFSFRLEQPYFDQPPLAMFFIALPAKIFGYTDFVQVPQMLVRIPVLIASIFSLYLTYILAKRLFNTKVALLAILVYGLTPFYIFSQRQSYLENFLTPVLLFGFINLFNYLAKPKSINLLILIIVSLISGWIKIIGFGLPLIIAFWLLKKKAIKPFFLIILSGGFSFLLYLLYGLSINAEQFRFLLHAQSIRGMYLSSFFSILTEPKFYEPFNDGLYLFNFFAMFFIFVNNKYFNKIKFLALNFTFWLIFIILTTDPGNPPWYRYPLFPLLSIASGYYLNYLLEKPTLVTLFPLILLGFTNLDLLSITYNHLFLRIGFLLIIFLFILQYFLPPLPKIIRLYKNLTIVILTIIFLINCYVPLKYLSNRCKISNCLLPDKIVVKNRGN